LGLTSCFTASYSPQSNGMSETFVNTLKRDYVYTNDCSDAETVLKMLPKWIED
jgi:transposase InsO family protein